MGLSNNLKKQVDIPVWEWARFAPGASSAVSSTTSADNSTYHVNHGRYIYYLQAAATIAGGIGVGTGFWRYDTVSDTYQQLAFPPVVPATFSGMQFVSGHGYYGRVLSAGANTITCAALTGQTLKSYDIRIISGTGVGQHRVITSVSDPIIADNGTLTTLPTTPETSVIDANKNWVINQWVGYQVRFVAATGNSVVRKILYNSATTLYFSDTNKYAEEASAYCPIVTITNAALTIGALGTQYQIESSVLTMDSAWATQPDATSRFLVHSGAIWLLTAGTTSYLMQYYDVASDLWYVRNPGSNTSPAIANGTDGTIINTGEVAQITDRGTATGSQTSTTLQDTTKSWAVNALSAASYKVRIFSGTGQGQVRTILSNTSNTITVSSWTTTPDSTSLYIIDSMEGGTATGAGASTQTGSSTGTIQGNVFTAGTTTGAYFAGQILTGTGVMDTLTVTSSQGACFTAGIQTTVLVAYGTTTGITAGMYVTLLNGSGTLSAGTKVVSTTSNTITLSLAPSVALANATLQFMDAYVATGVSSNGVVVTVGSTTGLYAGMVISVLSGTGAVVVGTYVTNVVNSTTFHVSTAPSTAFSAAVILGTQYQTIISGQLSGIPGGAGTYTVWPPQNVASTTIIGTGIASLTDTTKNWPLHRWNGQSVRIISGTGMGQVRSIIGTKCNNTAAYTSSAGATSSGNIITVSSTTNLSVGMMVAITAGVGAVAWNTTVTGITDSTHFTVSANPTTPLSGGASVVSAYSNNTLFVTPPWTTTPDSTSSYVIHGDSDKLYFSMGGQTPTFIHNVEADTVTLGRMFDYGVARSAASQYADQTATAITSGSPVQTVNYVVGTGTAYLSAAGATSSGTLVTVGTTNGLLVGCPVTVSAGIGTFAAGSYVAAINSATTFTVSATPSVALSGGASVVSGVASALAYFGMGPFATTALSGTGSTATATFGSLAGSTYSGTTTIPVGSLITVMGAIPSTYNGTFVVTASSAGSVSWASSASGSQTTAGIISGGSIFPVQASSATISGCLPAGYNGTITATAAAAGFVTYATATVGQLTATGVISHTAQTTLTCSISSTTATVTFAGSTIFSVGTYISVVGVTTASAGTGSYNGVFQVTASSAGSVSYTIASNTPSGNASVQGTIQQATTMQLVTTANNHHYKAGQSIAHTGDMHFANANTNITAAITPLPGTTTQYTYTTGGPAGSMIVFPQSTSILVDSTKSWIPNQWANCIVTYNSTQYTGGVTGPNILSAYIVANTATKLIFAAAQSVAPTAGLSRYVITASQASLSNSMLGTMDNGLALGVLTTTQIQDNTKYWAFPANVVQVAAGATSGQSTITVVSASGIYPGMYVAVTTNTAGSLTLPSGTTVVSISGLVITLSNTLSGTTGSTTFTFFATCTSSGSTITVAGYTTQGLQPGMYLGVNSIDNIKNTTTGQIQYNVAGAFVANGGVALTTTYVTAVTGTTTFTVSTAPAIPLVNANVTASFWYTNQWVGRRVRLTTGNGTNFLEQAVTASTTTGILTFGVAFGSAPVSGVTGYAILQQPNRGVGTALYWNYGQSDFTRRGIYLLQARGGGVTGFDRLNLMTDFWDFLTPTPNYEVLTTGAMYAYDGVDRLYFTPQVTQRVYYLDIDKMSIHGGSQYPYTAGTAIAGNRMETFTTTDGLKYLWLNRHSNQECFKLLLFF